MKVKRQPHLSDCQSGGGELREQTAEDGGMEVHQQAALSAERERGRRLLPACIGAEY